MKVKGWQIAVIVLGLAIGGFSIVRAFSNTGPDLKYSMVLLDAETADMFTIDDYRETRVILPANRPGKPGEYALIPIEKDEAGHWRATGNGQAMLRGLKVPIKAFDVSSGDVIVEPKDAGKYSR